jgi:biopolymer transport protein ExbB
MDSSKKYARRVPTNRRPVFTHALCMALVLVLSTGPMVTQIWAQDVPPEPAGAPALPPAAAGPPTATPPAVSGDGAERSGKSFIAHAFESAGVGWSLLMGVISISMVALSVFLLMELRLSAATPADLVEEFSRQVNARQFTQAQALLAENPSLLARALSAGLPKLQYGLDEAAEATNRKVEEFRAGKELIISFMAVIGQLGPLLGLVGTVYGMINSFQKLGTSSGNVDTKSLAGDISHALVVTLMGVGVAVPAIFFFTFFSKRLIQLTVEVNNTAMDLLTHVYSVMRKAGGAAPAPVAAPAPTNR